MRAVARKAKPHRVQAVLLALLAGFLALVALPDDQGQVRVNGVAFLWWYGGLLAPVLALVAGLVFGDPSSEGRASAPDPPPSSR
jgi:hypothetical protein